MTKPKLLNNVKFFQKCILVDNEGKILVLRRDPADKRRPNCWDLPGGNYEKGESVEEFIRREIREETGLIAHTLRPIFITNKGGKDYGNINVIAVCQFCNDWEGKIKLSNEHVEYRWVTPVEFLNFEFGDDGGFFKGSLNAYTSLPSHA